MIKISLLISYLTVATSIAAAQSYQGIDRTISFGISGGYSFSDMLLTSPYKEDIYATEATPFSLGLTADFKFNDYFSIMPGISYAGKGGNLNAIYVAESGTQVDIYDVYKLHYLEVPVDFIAHWPFPSGAEIFIGAGPYFSYGLNGTNSQSNFYQTEVEKIKFGTNGDFKSTDFGVTSILGFRAARGWSIGLNVERGFSNIMQNNTTGIDASKINTFSFYFSLGQSF